MPASALDCALNLVVLHFAPALGTSGQFNDTHCGHLDCKLSAGIMCLCLGPH